MTLSERQEQLMQLIRARGRCNILDLAEQLGVSDETVRRNLKPMVAQGLVARTHGSVALSERASEPPFQRRMQEQVQAKQCIAELMAQFIQDGDSLMMDTGSTNAFIAQALQNKNNLSVITNCTEIGRIFAHRANNRAYITGGELRADDAAAFGPSAIDFVRQFQVRYAVLSVGAITESGAIMDFHLEEAEFSRALMAQAQTRVVVADHSKFLQRALVTVCEAQEIDVLVTDREPQGLLLQALNDHGVQLLTPTTLSSD